MSLQQQFKIGLVAAAAMFCSASFSQEVQMPQKPAAETQDKKVKSVKTDAVKKEEADSQNEQKLRFVTKEGTGGSKTISQSPQVTLPDSPLSQPAGDVNKILEEAKRAGGVALDSIQREINMPGLKKDDPTLKPFVLHTRNGVNEIIKLSSTLLNRIATPFKKPVLIDANDVAYKIVGSDIYYMPVGDNPTGLFITDSLNTSQTISLTVIPDNSIPGQNLIVKMEDLRAIKNLALAASTEDEAEISQPKASDYTSFIRSVMTQAVKGKIPGFSPVPLEGGVARMGEINITPELVFTGSVLDVYRYKIQNISNKSIDLSETAFARDGVKAISFFPLSSLESGQESYVFLLAEKPESAKEDN